jgi:hypothetical protein
MDSLYQAAGRATTPYMSSVRTRDHSQVTCVVDTRPECKGVGQEADCYCGARRAHRCESAVFYHRAISATRPFGMNNWIQLFIPNGLVALITRW